MFYKGENIPSGYEYPLPDTRGGASVVERKSERVISAPVLRQLREAAREESKKQDK